MRMLVLSVLTAASLAVADVPNHYQPIEFLIGHCWKGELQGGKLTDEHCFSWIYDRKFVRDVHVLRGGGRPESTGESIYYWDESSGTLQYIYFESDGGFSHGQATSDGDAVRFPPTAFVENGQTSIYRSTWKRSGPQAYEIVTEFQKGSEWAPGWSVRMVQSRDNVSATGPSRN